MEQYQDIWIDGEVEKGVRECESRYESIRKQLEPYKNKPFTVLDIGANLGYFSLRIAHEFPKAVCVMIEHDYADWLKGIADRNGLKNVIILKKQVSKTELERLADCEFFDVVLALNVVHHIGYDSLPAIERLGELLIVETPSPYDKGSCGQKELQPIFEHIEARYSFIGRFSRHTSTELSLMSCLKSKKNGLKRKFWDADDNGNKGVSDIKIQRGKYINTRKEGVEKREWYAGINLRTFQHLNGIYPWKLEICVSVGESDWKQHSDLSPWNIIVQGSGVKLIDVNDSRYQKEPVAQLEKLISGIMTDTVLPIKHYF